VEKEDSQEMAVADPWEGPEAKLLETMKILDPQNLSNLYVSVREEQMEKLIVFLSHHINNMEGGFVHLCGMPGTGKTLCTHLAISRVKVYMEQKRLTLPNVIRINCTHYQDEPAKLFQDVWEQVTAGRSGKQEMPSVTEAEERLSVRFTIRRNLGMTILILDEMDLLRFDTAAGAAVLQSLLSMALDGCALTVIGISNTLDQRWQSLLPAQHRTTDTSKYGIEFPSYNDEQLMKIVQDRLEGRFHVSLMTLVLRKHLYQRPAVW